MFNLPPFPPHDPNRWQTADELDDRDRTNGIRANEARAVLPDACPEDFDDLVDLAVAIFHRLHALGEDPVKFLPRVVNHFVQEAGPLP